MIDNSTSQGQQGQQHIDVHYAAVEVAKWVKNRAGFLDENLDIQDDNIQNYHVEDYKLVARSINQIEHGLAELRPLMERLAKVSSSYWTLPRQQEIFFSGFFWGFVTILVPAGILWYFGVITLNEWELDLVLHWW